MCFKQAMLQHLCSPISIVVQNIKLKHIVGTCGPACEGLGDAVVWQFFTPPLSHEEQICSEFRSTRVLVVYRLVHECGGHCWDGNIK